MNFTTLQDRLRRLLLARISAGEFTGMALAARVGFQQAHISNFLNQKRSLSIDAMDQVLASLHLSVVDLIDNAEIEHRITAAAPKLDKQFESVPLVDVHTATTARVFPQQKILDFLNFKKVFLRRLQQDCDPQRKQWTRFVLIKADSDNVAAMYPRLSPGATLLIDRHYNSLKSYRRAERNMYLVRKSSDCMVRYVALHDNQLSLRPQNDSKPLVLIEIPKGRHFPECIVGRVCHVGIEI
jgi:hypothetical protein